MRSSIRVLLSGLFFVFIVLIFCNVNCKAEDYSGKVIDDFRDVGNWKAFKSEEAEINLASGKGFKGNSLRLNFDFTKRKGYVVASRDISLSLPQDYKFIFYIKGSSPDNNLEFKVIDDNGNTYWKKWVNFKFPDNWKKVVVSKKNLAFGWGPAYSKELKQAKRIEFGISCGEGGKGSVEITGLSLVSNTKASAEIKTKTRASSCADKYLPENAIDGNLGTSWRSEPSDGQWLELDFGQQEEMGGVYIYWDQDFARSYDVAISDDGRDWSVIYSVTNGNGGRDRVFFDETQTRFLRVLCKESATKKGFGVKEIEVKPPEAGDATRKSYETAAQQSPRGYYPRWLGKEGTFWTIVGVEDDEKEAILSEEGTIEPHKRGFSIMPFLYLDGKLITREDVKVTQSLERDYLPIPSVKWKHKDISLVLQLFAYGKVKESVVYARYKVENNREEPLSGKLFLTIRPFQIYPPWSYHEGGGFSPIYNMQYKNYTVTVNEKQKIFPLTKPDAFGIQSGLVKVGDLPEGDIVNVIQKGTVPTCKDLSEDANWDSTDWDASGAIEYDFTLGPKQSKDYFVAIPLYDKKPDLNIDMEESQISPEFQRLFRETVDFWESRVNKVEIDIPEVDMINTLKSNIAYNLITKDGPGFQPGSRNYDKSWIRDGGIQGNTLLEMGFTNEIKRFIDWYATYQYETGEIPPIIRPVEGPEPVDEYDSQGEFVFIIRQYYLFTKDKGWLEGKLPAVVKALKYLVFLRDQRLTAEYRDSAEKRIFYGILPDSISHEGYVPPVHSCWDDFWALEGWTAGRDIAKILGRDGLVKWTENEYQALKESFYKSLDLAIKQKNINYIPGCIEKGDCDPAATSGAIIYCEELGNLPKVPLKNMYDKYYSDLRRRMASTTRDIFGPYELRVATAFAYMGQKERALNLLRFMLNHRQPPAWNQWAEVIDTDYRAPIYLGDVPHTWIGAEYINAVRSLFAYELDDRLILAAGIDDKWLESGVSVKNLPTYYGDINYNARKEDNILKVKLWGEAVTPPSGFIFKVPSADKVSRVSINGKVNENFSGNEIVFNKLPEEITIYYNMTK